jgi:hypothetical protein
MSYPFKRQCKDYADNVFQNYGEKIQIYLSAGKKEAKSFDKYRNVGYDTLNQPPIIIKALVSDIKGNELILKQLGLAEVGAKRLTIRDCDIQFFKVASRVVYKDQDFYVYHQAVGNKMQVVVGDLGYSTILVFQKVNK